MIKYGVKIRKQINEGIMNPKNVSPTKMLSIELEEMMNIKYFSDKPTNGVNAIKRKLFR